MNNLSILQRASEMSDRAEAIALIRQALNLPESDVANRVLTWPTRWAKLQPFSRLMEIGEWLNAEAFAAIEMAETPTLAGTADLLDRSKTGARRTFD